MAVCMIHMYEALASSRNKELSSQAERTQTSLWNSCVSEAWRVCAVWSTAGMRIFSQNSSRFATPDFIMSEIIIYHTYT